VYVKRVIIENFQSHRHTDLELSPGLNVIVGESDRGKSAILRALRWVFYNEPRGADFVRAGATECRVTVVLDDGTAITRERSGNRNRYLVRRGGQVSVYEGFGSEVPPAVAAAHGVAKVRLDDDLEVALHLAGQLEAPFLLEQSGSVRARAIGRLYGVHVVDAALRGVLRDVQRLQQEEREVDEEIRRLDARLEEFADLPLLEERLGRVRTVLQRAEELSARRALLAALASRLHAVREEVARNRSLLERLGPVAAAEEAVERARQAQRDLVLLRQRREALEQNRRHAGVLRGILERTARVREANQALEGATRARERRAALERAAVRLHRVGRARREAVLVAERTGGVPAAESLVAALADALARRAWLAERAGRLADLGERRARGRAYLAERVREQEGLARQYAALLGRLKRCPVCFGELDRATVRRILIELVGGE
jgi:exonuclease SbcC